MSSRTKVTWAQYTSYLINPPNVTETSQTIINIHIVKQVLQDMEKDKTKKYIL